MTIEKVRERVKTNYESPAWKLVKRIVDEMNKRGIEPDGIILWDGGQKPLGTRLIGVEPVYRSNGTSEDVSARIVIYEVVKLGMMQIAKIKVPGGASEKVINNRIDKALAYK